MNELTEEQFLIQEKAKMHIEFFDLLSRLPIPYVRSVLAKMGIDHESIVPSPAERMPFVVTIYRYLTSNNLVNNVIFALIRE